MTKSYIFCFVFLCFFVTNILGQESPNITILCGDSKEKVSTYIKKLTSDNPNFVCKVETEWDEKFKCLGTSYSLFINDLPYTVVVCCGDEVHHLITLIKDLSGKVDLEYIKKQRDELRAKNNFMNATYLGNGVYTYSSNSISYYFSIISYVLNGFRITVEINSLHKDAIPQIRSAMSSAKGLFIF